MQLKNFSLTFRGIYVLSYCFLKKKKKSNIPQVSSNQGTLTCQISPSNYITTNNQGRGRGRKKKERKKWNKKKGKRSVLKYKFSREQRRLVAKLRVGLSRQTAMALLPLSLKHLLKLVVVVVVVVSCTLQQAGSQKQI